MPCLVVDTTHLYECHISGDTELLGGVKGESFRWGVGLIGDTSLATQGMVVTTEDAAAHLDVTITNEVCEENGCLKVMTMRRNAPMVVSVGIVCDRYEIAHLDVQPEDVKWIYLDMGIVYEVTSNVSWEIEY